MRIYTERLDPQQYYARRQTLLCLSYTYEAEMYRRLRHREGKSARNVTIDDALILHTFDKAPLDLHVDNAARGNHAQLLARAHSMLGNNALAEAHLKRAEDIAFHLDKQTSPLYVCFGPCSIYEEWAQHYKKINKFEKSFESIEKAQEYASLVPRWQIPVKLTKGNLYIARAVNSENITSWELPKSEDFQTGLYLVQDAVKLATKAGHQRQIRLAEHSVRKLSELSAKSTLAQQVLLDTLKQIIEPNIEATV